MYGWRHLCDCPKFNAVTVTWFLNSDSFTFIYLVYRCFSLEQLSPDLYHKIRQLLNSPFSFFSPFISVIRLMDRPWVLSLSFLHYGSKQPDVPALIIHCPTSLGVSERANEWAQRSEWVKWAGWSKRMGEPWKRTNERLTQHLRLGSLSFWTIVIW